ncbi:hypothetical protein ACQPYK_26195 [Streptosporangium sp. CA-135522]|uniref:hypothetical protein n=1 Tax=Streptosporangium sp. CA-135522 TaxID=3240072 RepID=UPI003D8B5AC9
MSSCTTPLPGPVIPEIPPAPPGMFIGLDPPEHTRYRKLLTGTFTARRIRLLTERVEQITAEHLDAMERHGPPVDLVTAFALPIPTLLICELLGVPYAERESFQQYAIAVNDNDTAPEERYGAMMGLGELSARTGSGQTCRAHRRSAQRPDHRRPDRSGARPGPPDQGARPALPGHPDRV